MLCIYGHSLFHCNGWCFAWSIAASGGTNICLRKVDPELVMQLIAAHKVDYFCGAPIVLSMILNLPKENKPALLTMLKSWLLGQLPCCHY